MLYIDIITPSIGRASLLRGCASVTAQAFRHYTHYVMFDREGASKPASVAPDANLRMAWLPRENVFGHNTICTPMYYYWLNCDTNNGWGTIRVSNVGIVREFTPQKVRIREGHPYPLSENVSNGGWYFSYLGGVAGIQQKLISFAHTDLSGSEFTDAVRSEEATNARRDLFGRPGSMRIVLIDDSFPREVVQHRRTNQHLIRE